MAKTCFFISRIGEHDSPERAFSDKLLMHIVEPALTKCGYEKPVRADHIAKPGVITTQIFRHLWDDDLVVADLTGHNPNVFYELAVRHMTRRPVIHMIRAGEKIPFDVAPNRTIEFDFDIERVQLAERSLKAMISDASQSDHIQTPLSVALDSVMNYQHEMAVLVPTHRRTPANSEYFVKAFSSGGEVLFISVMSQHTLKNMESLLKSAVRTSTKLRVLTWDPGIEPVVIQSFRQHFGENDDREERSESQVQDAAAIWQYLMDKLKGSLDLDVRTYRSAPILQGVLVSGQWAYFEMLPYRTATEERPALLLTPGRNPHTFSLYWDRYMQLFQGSPPVAQFLKAQPVNRQR